MRPLALACVLLLPAAASAQQIWRWTDDAGEVHYTDDERSIPERHRKAAKTTSGDDIGELTTSGEPGATDAETGEASLSTEPVTRGAAMVERSDAAAEKTWRADFRKARERIAQLEQALERDRQLIDPASGGLGVKVDGAGIVKPNPEYAKAQARISRNEAELKRAQEQLAELERRASRAAVPLEWRR